MEWQPTLRWPLKDGQPALRVVVQGRQAFIGAVESLRAVGSAFAMHEGRDRDDRCSNWLCICIAERVS